MDNQESSPSKTEPKKDNSSLNGSNHSQQQRQNGLNGSNHRRGPFSKKSPASVTLRKKSTSSTLSWILSTAVAFSLFQTFSYQPPPHLSNSPGGNLALPHPQLSHPSNRKVKVPAVKIRKSRRQEAAVMKKIPSLEEQQENERQALQRLRNLPENFGRERAVFKQAGERSLVEILKDAGVYDSLEKSEIKKLSKLEHTIRSLYGPFSANQTTTTTSANGSKNNSTNAEGPVIYGMDTCEAYRQLVPNLRDRYVAPAGMFNTGTNNLEYSMKYNLEWYGTGAKAYYQVPWGKHRMEARRLRHVAKTGKSSGLDQTKCLPIVIVRDPYHWMQSMCKAHYAAFWKHGPHRCPNLVPSEHDHHLFKQVDWDKSKLHNRRDKDKLSNSTKGRKRVHANDDEVTETFQVVVKFDTNDIEFFDSLIDLWNDWYRPYWENKQKYPRLMVRFEDMLLHAPEVLAKVGECIGVPLKKSFKYQTDSAKFHGSHTTFYTAITKTADESKRKLGLTLKDKIYAAKHLDPELMHAFQYRAIED
ncbi:hypothetical protein ACA910_015571 [Epithemia clementina (nom. ined.)]